MLSATNEYLGMRYWIRANKDKFKGVTASEYKEFTSGVLKNCRESSIKYLYLTIEFGDGTGIVYLCVWQN